MEEENVLAKQVLDFAFGIHRTLGPGLLESVYEQVLAWKLMQSGLRVERQVPVAFVYENIRFEQAFRLDLLVGGCLVVEVKSVEELCPVHSRQLLTYLRLSDRRLGLLINFNQPYLRDGIERVVNGL